MRRMIDLTSPYATGEWDGKSKVINLSKTLTPGVYILTFEEVGYVEFLTAMICVPAVTENVDESCSSLFWSQDASISCKWTITSPYLPANCNSLSLWGVNDIQPALSIEHFTVYKLI